MTLEQQLFIHFVCLYDFKADEVQVHPVVQKLRIKTSYKRYLSIQTLLYTFDSNNCEACGDVVKGSCKVKSSHLHRGKQSKKSIQFHVAHAQ